MDRVFLQGLQYLTLTICHVNDVWTGYSFKVYNPIHTICHVNDVWTGYSFKIYNPVNQIRVAGCQRDVIINYIPIVWYVYGTTLYIACYSSSSYYNKQGPGVEYSIFVLFISTGFNHADRLKGGQLYSSKTNYTNQLYPICI